MSTDDLSLIERIALLPPEDRAAAWAEVGVDPIRDAERIRWDWGLWARPKQKPPAGAWFTWVLYSGRGFGKTRAGAEWVIQRARDGFGPIALIGQTKADVRDTMVEIGESSIMKISPPDFMPHFEPSKRRLTWPNGVVATIFSGDEPDQLRGPQHQTIWADELAKWRYPEDAYSNAVLGLRVGSDPRQIITTTPRPIPILRTILNDPSTVHVTGSTTENMANLSPIFIRQIISMYGGTRLGLQELEGVLLEDVEGALFKTADIERYRVRRAPDQLLRVVIGVDPKASVNANSETGIVVAGLGPDGHAYVIGDYSTDGIPGIWAGEVVTAFFRHEANVIIAEVNNGGDMVEHTIRTIRDEHDRPIGQAIPVYKVHASRGKATRAEPISLLYEQGRIHHVGRFAGLEDQMVNWVPGESPSPDRVDALVWSISALLLKQPKSGRRKRRRRSRGRARATA